MTSIPPPQPPKLMIDFKVHLENDIVSLVQTEENHFEGLYKVGNNLIICLNSLFSATGLVMSTIF